MIGLRIGLLLIATIVIHDGYMAMSGHDHLMLAAGPVPACGQSELPGRHQHHQGGGHHEPEPNPAIPFELTEACSGLRAVAPLNREMGPALADVPLSTRPDPALSMLFAATSRTVVESPPPHPPNLNRAFFQVYRI